MSRDNSNRPPHGTDQWKLDRYPACPYGDSKPNYATLNRKHTWAVCALIDPNEWARTVPNMEQRAVWAWIMRFRKGLRTQQRTQLLKGGLNVPLAVRNGSTTAAYYRYGATKVHTTLHSNAYAAETDMLGGMALQTIKASLQGTPDPTLRERIIALSQWDDPEEALTTVCREVREHPLFRELVMRDGPEYYCLPDGLNGVGRETPISRPNLRSTNA